MDEHIDQLVDTTKSQKVANDNNDASNNDDSELEESDADDLIQGLIQAVFDKGIPILGILIRACPNLILSKLKLPLTL